MTDASNGPSLGPGHGSASGPTTPVPQYDYPAATGVATAPGAAGVPLADEPPPPAPGGRKRTGVLVGALVTALLVGGAGAFAYQSLSGSGSQPSDVLPGDAYAYVRLDIDPSAGQKVAAVRFLGKLKDVRNTLGSDDPRKKLWELVTKDAGNDCVAKFAYDTDIAPWLGDRVGAALRPGGTQEKPNVAIAVQVKDEAAAKDTLTRLFACDKSDDTELRMKDGYAIITPPGVGDATLAAAAKGTLSHNTGFTEDMAALGEQGVLSAWFDMGTGLKEIQKLSGDASPAPVGDAKGRVAAALRFDAEYLELAGVVRGGDPKVMPKGDGAEVANLPANTMAALHISGADQAIDASWPQLEKQLNTLGAMGAGQTDVLAEIERELGVKLPDDLKVLLGRSFTVAVPQQDFKSDAFVMGAKVVSSDAKRAAKLVGQLTGAAMGGSDALTTRVEGDKVYVATTPDYADDLKAGGRLVDAETFKAAVGDVTGSNAVLFLDLDKLEKTYVGELKGEERAVVEGMRAVGLNSSSTGNGESAFTLRVLAN
ncbi:DUF3352 domain-containing protein [Terrabacter sp. GCM10028922]|uniref:DUF3352 domain-containing protein n=1 Tax=Terrabacter sp. GCM10028922 TaxID=3273428 RepID=UPI00361D7519